MESRGANEISVSIRLPDDMNVFFSMKEDLYSAEDFADLRRDDLFEAEGRFYSATENGLIFLRECERVS